MSGHDNLVKMANQIAQFFASEPDDEAAVHGVRNHLRSFWTPAMRSKLRASHEDTEDSAGLHPLVQAALKRMEEHAP